MTAVHYPHPTSIPQLDGWLAYLDELLGSAPPFKIVSAAKFKTVPPAALAVWCKVRGLWTVATTELIDWLQPYVKGRVTIEIGAGRGSLGKGLAIPQTDACFITENAEYRALFESLEECTDPLPYWVEKMDAAEALEIHKPKVVIGSWISQLGDVSLRNSSPLGVDEEAMLRKIECYIHIGNARTHASKAILSVKHEEHRFDWLVGRSAAPRDNVIYVWGK